jgi:hypothetical protein
VVRCCSILPMTSAGVNLLKPLFSLIKVGKLISIAMYAVKILLTTFLSLHLSPLSALILFTILFNRLNISCGVLFSQMMNRLSSPFSQQILPSRTFLVPSWLTWSVSHICLAESIPSILSNSSGHKELRSMEAACILR